MHVVWNTGTLASFNLYFFRADQHCVQMMIAGISSQVKTMTYSFLLIRFSLPRPARTLLVWLSMKHLQPTTAIAVTTSTLTQGSLFLFLSSRMAREKRIAGGRKIMIQLMLLNRKKKEERRKDGIMQKELVCWRRKRIQQMLGEEGRRWGLLRL